MNKIQVVMLRGECWYAMDVSRGLFMPIDKTMSGSINLVDGTSRNQTAPFLISNHGRYIWCEDGFTMTYRRGKISCVNEPSKHSIDLYDGFGTLKEAYLDAVAKHFPFGEEYPDECLFREPLYCKYLGDATLQSEEDIMNYATSIIDSGMRPGVITIDCGWQVAIGDWDFDLTKVPQPRAMVDKLHEMGFKVRLWICPFISEEADSFEFLKYGDMLVLDKTGKVAKRCWWNGRDALLDLSNPDSVEWFKSKCDDLMRDYGIDGFKFGCGESSFYRNSDITYNAVDANTESMLYAKIASSYNMSEIRACFKGGGFKVTTRLYDKQYRFEKGGLEDVVPSMLLQGIMGYPYGCPDMVGGSEFDVMSKVQDNGGNMELLVRYAEIASLMPVMQYSLPIWNIGNDYVSHLLRVAFDVHEKYANYIMSLVKNTAKTGEPIVRYLEYEFPHQGYHMVNNMFMLGSRYLVAPIVEQGKYKLTIRLPKGLWQYVDGKIYEGEVTVDAPLEVLPIFEKIR